MDELIARLEAEAAKAAANAPRCRTDEARWANEGIAAGLRIAIEHARRLGSAPAAHDEGPTVAELPPPPCWPLEKEGL